MLKTSTDFSKVVSFHDGYLNILKANGRTIEASLVERVPYSEQALGIIRYYQAKTAGDELDIVVAIPFTYSLKVSTNNLIELKSFHGNGESEFYTIAQIQKKDTSPASIWITLKDGGLAYDDQR